MYVRVSTRTCSYVTFAGLVLAGKTSLARLWLDHLVQSTPRLSETVAHLASVRTETFRSVEIYTNASYLPAPS